MKKYVQLLNFLRPVGIIPIAQFAEDKIIRTLNLSDLIGSEAVGILNLAPQKRLSLHTYVQIVC
jgi:hypothetical protein